ncbi:glycosyltransferase family 4 protein [Telmatospirillum sp. J64-1]|uniref:glycosyltransferase family 4 protein n=1 Tax=Telmatospirillum sp. J64-1 TaxID=2502183 RepID=UPI00115E5763|nr:glycosyltransferase family 4 protein [Telmatospirillum sp. J64-1]
MAYDRAMVTIGFSISTLRRCGPVILLRDLLAGLDRSRFAPAIFTLSPEPEDSLLAAFHALDIPVEQAGLGRGAGMAGLIPAWRRFLKRHRPRIMHSHCLRSDALNALLTRQARRVCTIHNDPPLEYAFRFGPLPGRGLARLHMRLVRDFDAICCVSKAVRDRLAENGARNAQILRNGIDTARFRPACEEEKRALRHRLGLPQDARILLSAGILAPRKDPLALIDAFTALGRQGCLLVMLGDGPLAAACRAAATPVILLPGQVAHPEDYYRTADLYVSASQAEGLPLAVLEALACGLPACLSPIPPHAEAASLLPGRARLFQPGRLAEALARMLDDGPPRLETLPTDALSATAMARKYQALYERLAE